MKLQQNYQGGTTMTTPAIPTREFDGAQIPQSGTFALDPDHTTVWFVARHLVVSKVRGSFSDVSGSITIAPEPLASAVEVTIGVASISTGQPDRDNHLRSADFLELDKYPNMTYRSTGVKSWSGNEFVLDGELTIRGVSRPVELNVEYDGAAISPYGKEVIAFTASTEIDREDWGINWNQALETGGVLVGKKIKVEITSEAIRS
jgi:polyisoprenoid-binding protein YceI